MEKHKSVLLNEVLDYLNIKSSLTYVDMTLGYGGHSSEILKRLDKGFLYSFDQDQDAIDYSMKRLSEISSNFKIIKSNFRFAKEHLKELGIEKVDGIMFDLGVSSPQLDDASRGFSYHNDAYLDMRMDKSAKKDAHMVVNTYSEQDLTRIFKVYGEEKFANKIAKNICKKRKIKPIDTTLQLVDVISEVIPIKEKLKKHPARKVFQAIRIEVNDELKAFEDALYDALDMLNINGRICVITFHSLEDRICKNIFKEKTEVDKVIKGLPNVPLELLPSFKLINNHVLLPSDEELDDNLRSRSAKLRVIERIK